MEQKMQVDRGMLYIKHLLLACVITVILLCFAALLMYKMDLSGKGVGIMLVAAYILSNFIAGFFMGKKVEKRQFLWGFLVGLGYFFIVFLVSFLGNDYNVGDMGRCVLVFFLCTMSALFGGMVS